ncbi:MAG: SIS domain-containing protein [Oscillospiraceae bacterium]
MDKKERCEQLAAAFFEKHPELVGAQNDIMRAAGALVEMYEKNGQLLVCGNGGSSADADHIVGELMKGFMLRRPLALQEQQKFGQAFGNEGARIAAALQQGLPAISLGAHAALISAFANDVDPGLVYAQQVYGYGRKQDVLVGISTSGNAQNVVAALKTARVKEMVSIGLTGRDGGAFKELCDICIVAPAEETYRIQEHHIVIYHFLCTYVEAYFFDR